MGYNMPMGKQRTNPSHIFYRSCTGIWQTVWMESVPQNYIQKLDISADMDGKGKSGQGEGLRSMKHRASV